jgi:hypothetical protein
MSNSLSGESGAVFPGVLFSKRQCGLPESHSVGNAPARMKTSRTAKKGIQGNGADFGPSKKTGA